MKTVIVCMAICATAGLARAEHVTLVGTDTVATVIIADKPEESARLAAAEFTNHIALVTGRCLDIRSASNASEKGVKVFIGSLDSYPGEIPQTARDYIASAKQDEAAWAGTVDGNLHFVGRHEVAELYSVYHFLESKLGVIWFKAPVDGDPGIYVPKAATIELEPFAEGREPAFKYRLLDMVCARCEHPPYGSATAVRNGFQTPSVLLIDALDKPESDIYKFYRPREWRGEIQVGGSHMTMCGPVSVKKYFKEHPEYFALVNGKRTAGEQICFSNPDVWRIVADDVIERFHRNGDVGYYLFGLVDSAKGICECDGCKGMDPPPGVGRGISTRFNKCAQRIMELVWREIPTADLRVWAYSNYRDMPIGVLHDPRVKVQFCGIGRCYGHAFDDPNCPCNAKVYELMRGWMQVAPQVYTYEYLACTPMRYTCSEAVEERDIKNYHRLGVVGWKSEALFSGSVWVWPYAGWNVGFQSCWQWLWMAGKLLWDPSLSGQAIIDRAEEKYYGVAYPAMRRYQALRRRLWNESSVCLGYPRGDPRRPLLLNREGSKEQLLALLDEADALAAAGDDVTRFRVRQDRRWLNEYWIKPNDALVKRREQAYDVATAAAAPTIDGKGDDACWAGARRLTDFKIRKDPVPKDQAVDACVLHDATNFYVLVNAKEPNPSGIVVKESKPDTFQWFEDAVMVALAPPGDSGASYVIWANLDGVVYDTAHPGDDREDWNSGAVAKTERRADGWTLELKIPAVPKMHPEMKAGDYWSLMVVRRRPQNVGESCSTLGGGELNEVIQYLPIRLADVETVRVSDFGFAAEDSTEIVQKALDSGARRIVFDKKPGPWVVRPVFVRSNSEIIFEEGVELQAKRGEFRPVMDALMTLEGVTNVVLRGLGKGATFRMWGDDYRKPPYAHSEWRHALNLLSARQVTVENLTFLASGGDGIYLGEKRGPNVNVVIRDCVCDANHRQGVSVITARNLLIERTTLKNTRGTDPESGVDFEPNGRAQELVNCVMRDCTIERNAHVGCWFNLSHFTRETKPVSVTLENCRIVGNGGAAFMLGLNPSLPDESLPRGGFIRVKNCTLGGKGPAALFSAKRRGCVDTTFEDCVFDRCCSEHPNQPDVAFLVFDRQGAYDDGIVFRNVTIRQDRAREWFGAANRPWIAPPTAISGDVTVVSPAGTRRETLDADWIGKRFAVSADERFDFTHMGLDPDAAHPVDRAPGRTVALSPIRFRGAFRAWVYADGPREIVLRAVQETIGSRRPVTGPISVLSIDGRKVAEVSAPGTEQTDLRFTVSAAGFYSMAFDTKGNAIAFLSADVPFGIVPERANVKEHFQLDLYRSVGTIFFRHAHPKSSVLFVGGGGPEYAAMKVSDPAGNVLFEDGALGQWGFVKVGGKPSDGLYRIDVNRPDGLNWEDTFVDLRGEPAVFFLAPEKHW